MKQNIDCLLCTATQFPQGKIKGFKVSFEVDFAPFQPNSQKAAAIPNVRTVQVSHKNDAVVNSKLTIGGSYETKEQGVAPSDYHLNTDNPDKGHAITSFKDEVNYVPCEPSSCPEPSQPSTKQ